MFKKTEPKRIFQDLVRQIESAILEGRLKAGDKLPSQRELVEMFQTSRGPLREALRVLEQKGLVDIKLGVSGGAIVKTPDTSPVTRSLDLLIRHREISLEELAEFREGVEGSVSALAAERVSDEEIRELKSLLKEADQCIRAGVNGWEAFCRADTRIHVAIANASGNRVYGLVLRMVHDNIQRFYEAYPLKDPDIMHENYQDLCDIVSAIEQRRSTVVRSLVQSHVRRFRRYMMNQHNNVKSAEAG